MNLEEKIEVCKKRIKDFEETLRLMPEDTVIGRLCIIAYIKKENKKLEKLLNEQKEAKGG